MVMDARIDQVVTSGEITEDGATHAMTNNTWVIGDNDEVIVIDPGHDAQEILEKVGDREQVGSRHPAGTGAGVWAIE